MYSIIRCEVTVQGQTSLTKQNMKIYFFGVFLSADFRQKLKNWMKFPWKVSQKPVVLKAAEDDQIKSSMSYMDACLVI